MFKYERLVPIKECSCEEFIASWQCKHADAYIKGMEGKEYGRYT